jgi:CheY-like chemotaxis protein
VATLHRSRRARALRLHRIDKADAAAELGWEAESDAPTAFDIEHEPLVRQIVSTALGRRGWSVLEAADGTIVLTVAPETLDRLVADYSVPAVLSPSSARKARSIRNLRTAFTGRPAPAEGLVASGGSAGD